VRFLHLSHLPFSAIEAHGRLSSHSTSKNLLTWRPPEAAPPAKKRKTEPAPAPKEKVKAPAPKAAVEEDGEEEDEEEGDEEDDEEGEEEDAPAKKVVAKAAVDHPKAVEEVDDEEDED
jgi:hypothetical protein